MIVAAASREGGLRFWDSRDGRILRTLEAHGRESIRSLTLSRETGDWISVGKDRFLRQWDRSGALRHELPARWLRRALIAQVLPDGQRAITVSVDRTMNLWDIRTSRCLRVFPAEAGRALNGTLDREGLRVASLGHDQRLRIWSVNDGRPLGDFEASWGLTVGSATKAIDAVFLAFLDQDRILACLPNRSAVVFDISSGVAVAKWEASAPIGACAATPAGRLAIGDVEGHVLIMDVHEQRAMTR